MANKVLTRVWEHSQQRGAARCLIVALADVADEHGIAYPGVTYLAGMINEDEDYTYKLLRKLIESGELLHKAGGGRGRKTLYGVAVGLSDAQRERLNTALQSRVYYEKSSGNPVPQSRVSKNPVPQSRVSDEINPALFDDKPCTNYDPSQSGSDAPYRVRSQPAQNMILHDPGGDHESPPPNLLQNEVNGGGGESIELKATKTEAYYWMRENGVDDPGSAERHQHYDLNAIKATYRRIVGDATGAERKKLVGRFIKSLNADGPDKPKAPPPAAAQNGHRTAAPPDPVLPQAQAIKDILASRPVRKAST